MASYEQKYFDLKGGNFDCIKIRCAIKQFYVHDTRGLTNKTFYITNIKTQPDGTLTVLALRYNRKADDEAEAEGEITIHINTRNFVCGTSKVYKRIADMYTASFDHNEYIYNIFDDPEYENLPADFKDKIETNIKLHDPVSNSGPLKVYIMRHGDRADDEAAGHEVNSTVDKKEDTPLSPAGFVRANRVASDHIGPIDKIVTSPLLRCVQTAQSARDGLVSLGRFANDKKILMDTGLCEVMHSRVLKIPFKDFKLRTDAELGAKGINMTNFERALIPLPEMEETRGIGGTADKRYRETINRLAIESTALGHNSLLLVTHGDCLGSFIAMVAPSLSMYQVDYCGLLVAEYDKKTNTWKFLGEESKGIAVMGAD